MRWVETDAEFKASEAWVFARFRGALIFLVRRTAEEWPRSALRLFASLLKRRPTSAVVRGGLCMTFSSTDSVTVLRYLFVVFSVSSAVRVCTFEPPRDVATLDLMESAARLDDALVAVVLDAAVEEAFDVEVASAAAAAVVLLVSGA